MKKIIGLIAVLVIFSCKEKVKKQTEKQVQPIVIKEKQKEENRFTITYNCKFSENDNLQLFYTEDFKLHFSDELSVRKNVKASDDFTEVEFKLPQGVLPDRLRFDLGGNRNQKQIIIDKIVIKYKGDSIIIDQTNFLEMLVLNANVEYNEATNIITTKVINVEGNEVYDPYLYCSNTLVQALFNL